MVRLVSVQTRRSTYPLWIHSPNLRQRLHDDHDIVTGLGRRLHLAACAAWMDSDNAVMRYGVEQSGPRGSRLFYCLGNAPVVCSLAMPRLYAPTPFTTVRRAPQNAQVHLAILACSHSLTQNRFRLRNADIRLFCRLRAHACASEADCQAGALCAGRLGIAGPGQRGQGP